MQGLSAILCGPCYTKYCPLPIAVFAHCTVALYTDTPCPMNQMNTTCRHQQCCCCFGMPYHGLVFLRRACLLQVRHMVGALLAIGTGNLSPDVIAHKLTLGKSQLPGVLHNMLAPAASNMSLNVMSLLLVFAMNQSPVHFVIHK